LFQTGFNANRRSSPALGWGGASSKSANCWNLGIQREVNLIEHNGLGALAGGLQHEVRTVFTQQVSGVINEVALLWQSKPNPYRLGFFTSAAPVLARFHHQYLKTQPLSVGFFCGWLFSATPLPVPVSRHFTPFSLSVLCSALYRKTPCIQQRRGFARSGLRFSTAGVARPRARRTQKNRPKAVCWRRCWVRLGRRSARVAVASPAAGCRCGSDAPGRCRRRWPDRHRRSPVPNAPVGQSCWPVPG
jgi:hypothetical protein